MSIYDYKGYAIEVWVKQVDDGYDWLVKAADQLHRKNPGELARSESAAEKAALSFGQRMVDELIDKEGSRF